MNWIDRKALLPVAAALVLFVALSMAYFSPLMEGYHLKQGDRKTWQGGAQEILEHRDLNNGEDPLWTGSFFSGMPAYQISVQWKGNWLKPIDALFHAFLPHPAGTVFLYLLAMFVLLRVLKVDPWVSIVGAIAYGFSSYFIIIFEAGHNTKATAIGYMPLVLAGVWLLLRGNKLAGAAMLALFMGLEIGANHLQVTYYLGFLLLLLFLAEVWKAIGEKRIADLAVRSGFGAVAIALAALANSAVLMGTAEYAKYTTRGPSELTTLPDGSSADSLRTTGLDRDYVTAWSYGKQESFSLLVPSAKGGATEYLGNDRDALKSADPRYRENLGRMNHYWGDQSFTSGPVYLGAIVVLLLLLMLARAEGMARWWLIAAIPLIALLVNVGSPPLAALLVIGYLLAGVILYRDPLPYALFASLLLTLFLGWGRFYMPLTDFFLDHVPGYDKFRAVTIILVIVELAAPVLAVLYLDRLLKEGAWEKAMDMRFLVPVGGLVLVLLVLAVTPTSFFDFISDAEREQFNEQAADPEAEAQVIAFVDELKAVRVGIFTGDAWRSLLFVAAGAGLVFAFGRKMVGRAPVIAGMGLLILADLWAVDKRFLNNEKEKGKYLQWEQAESAKIPYPATAADRSILEAEENAKSKAVAEQLVNKWKEDRKGASGRDKLVAADEQLLARFAGVRRAGHYRVLDMRDPFNDARIAYYHRSVGGYHGAKLKRYQELIGFHLAPEMAAIRAGLGKGATLESVTGVLAQQGVINMLNTRWLVLDPARPALRNLNAFGPAWFVDGIRWVKNADEEIAALGEVRLDSLAVVDERWKQQLGDAAIVPDPSAEITLDAYATDRLDYTVRSNSGGVVVFSEVHYAPDWQATIDGQAVDHARANYVLRALRVPPGEHKVVFEVHSRSYELGNSLSMAGSASILLLVLGALFLRWKHARNVEG